MYDNIGSKIKGLAVFVCVAGIIICVAYGIAAITANPSRNTLAGLLTIAIGSVGAWLGSLALYGFGHLIENSDYCVVALQNLEKVVQGSLSGKQESSTGNNYEYKPSRMVATSGGKWICSECGTANSGDTMICKDCGTTRGNKTKKYN